MYNEGKLNESTRITKNISYRGASTIEIKCKNELNLP